MKKIYRTRNEIVGVFAHWIVRQSPILPENLTEIINYVNDYVQDYHPKERHVVTFKNEDALKDFVRLCVFGSSKITDLNKSQAEKRGERVSDIMFVSAYHEPKPEYDFVDLDALRMNICRQLLLDD